MPQQDPDTLHPGMNLGERHPRAHRAAEVEVFGFWVFMMSDAIIFGLLFATYVSMRDAVEGGPSAASVFDMKSVFAETMLLLVSSFTFGMASLALKYNDRPAALRIWLVVTLVLGSAFLFLEVHDFITMVANGAVPQVSGAMSAFWALVPLHGLHVFFASVWLVAILLQTQIHGLDDQAKVAVLRLAVLWHFLDLIWIGIFTVVYVGAFV